MHGSVVCCFLLIFFFFLLSGTPLYGLPWWLSCEVFPYNARDTGDVGSIFLGGRSSGGGHGNPLQASWRIPWTEATVHGVAKRQTWLSYWHFHFRRRVVVPYPGFTVFPIGSNVEHLCTCSSIIYIFSFAMHLSKLFDYFQLWPCFLIVELRHSSCILDTNPL